MKRLVAAMVVTVLAGFGAGCGDGGGGSATAETVGDDAAASAGNDGGSTEEAPSAEELTVLVTNDDGVAGAGLDAIVEALSVRDGFDVVVVAPAENRSGAGGRTSTGGVSTVETTTPSGHPAVAVAGYPADAVLWALAEGGIEPDLVVSGINAGQNIGPLVPVSGTVGAARQAAQMGVPALAVSQGAGEPPDYPTAVQATLAWIDQHHPALAAGTFDAAEVTSINVPTCTGTEVQGTVEGPNAAQSALDLTDVDCSGTAPPTDDVTAFVNGWIAVTSLAATGSITG